MKTIEEIRLENLKTLCAGFKSQRQFAIKLGKSAQQVNQWFRTGQSHAPLGSTQAREIEEILDKPRGWMDHDHEEYPTKQEA